MCTLAPCRSTVSRQVNRLVTDLRSTHRPTVEVHMIQKSFCVRPVQRRRPLLRQSVARVLSRCRTRSRRSRDVLSPTLGPFVLQRVTATFTPRSASSTRSCTGCRASSRAACASGVGTTLRAGTATTANRATSRTPPKTSPTHKSAGVSSSPKYLLSLRRLVVLSLLVFVIFSIWWRPCICCLLLGTSPTHTSAGVSSSPRYLVSLRRLVGGVLVGVLVVFSKMMTTLRLSLIVVFFFRSYYFNV